MPTFNESLPMADQVVGLPDSGIRFIVPETVTECLPKIVEYHVTISSAGGTQLVSVVTKEDKLIPTYTKHLVDFKVTFEQWAQLSDAVSIYEDFAKNLDHPGMLWKTSFPYPNMSNETKPYKTNNGTTVETCVLGEVEGGMTDQLSDIWPLGVFEQ
jgi:hypothetical protein